MNDIFTIPKFKQYLQELQAKTLSPEEVATKLNTLRVFLKWALKKGYINDSLYYQLDNETAKFKPSQPPTEAKQTPPLQNSTATKPQETLQHLVDMKRFTPYALVSGILLLLIISVFFHPLFKQNKTDSLSNKTGAPAGKVLAFHGTLADQLGNPISTKTDVSFNIYTVPSGGNPIYTGACQGENAITPTIKGEFNVSIGQDCDMKPIPPELLSQNTELYLGIKPGNDQEMSPREKITNVGYAKDTNTIEGLPLGNSTNSIPFINSQGDLLMSSENPSIRSTLSSAHFTLSSGSDLIAQTAATGDIILQATESGSLKFRTGGSTDADNRFIITPEGNVGILSANPTLFALQVGGSIGPSFKNLYDLGSPLTQWANVYSQKFYQNGYEVCDSSNNCQNGSSWSHLTSPNQALSLSMGNYATNFTYSDATGTSNLFNLTDTAGNTGTGYLFNVNTANSSSVNPFHIGAQGSDALTVLANGNVGIGIANPSAPFHVKQTGNHTTDSFGAVIDNNTSNSSTDGINKYGLYINSTGAFTGGTGKATNNYALYITGAAGADNNYDIYAAGSGAYLSSGGNWTNASSRTLKTNFTAIDTDDILNKIDQLGITTWNYKKEDPTVKHLGPVAEDFYNLFHLGGNNATISTIDPAGVALAGIQALDRKVTNISNNLNEFNLDKYGDIIPQTTNDYAYDGNIQNAKNQISHQSFTLASAFNTMIQRSEAFSNIVTASLTTGVTNTTDAIVENTLVAKNILVDTLRSTNAEIDNLTTNIINAREKISTPVIQTETLVATKEANITSVNTNQIQPLNDNLTINLNTPSSTESANQSKGAMAQLIIKGLNNKTVTTVDAEGNITTDGTITSHDATVSGTLAAGSINATTASFSGELIANNIKSTQIDNLGSQLSENTQSINDINNNINQVQKLISDIKTAPLPTVTPVQPQNLPPTTDATFNQVTTNSLVSLDTANLYRAQVTDTLSVGSLMIKDNSLLALSQNLDISSLSQVSFFNDVVVIAKDGAVTIKNPVVANGGIKTPSLSPTDGQNLNIQLNHQDGQLNVKDETGSTNASIDASGSAHFADISLNTYMNATASGAIIAAPDNFTRNGLYSPAIETTTQTAGNGIVPQGSSEVVIYNTKVKNDSLIYLTPTGQSIGSTLTVISKETCEQAGQTPCRPYFKVATTSPATTNLPFNWLIIN